MSDWTQLERAYFNVGLSVGMCVGAMFVGLAWWLS